MSICTSITPSRPAISGFYTSTRCGSLARENGFQRRPASQLHAADQPDDDVDPSQQVFQCRDGRTLPRYMAQSVDLPDGLYLGLFNGRDDPLGSPLVTGFDGPLIGRLRYCHTVEARDLKLEFLDPFEGYRFFPDMEHIAGRDGQTPTGRITMPIELVLNAGAIVFDGRYFADWTVFVISSVRTVIGRDLRSQRRM
ncbi:MULTISPECIES: hypothetical protein [Paraburkholderia]|uniref:Uncharacterized protein n=1 Tax=Paraburkholderia podalyriae TaxID=1938811 RepID=A0ABR7PSN3_9BURK|nr:hypothetical protein [Paraburkholderia podalyriae]MBC8749269.1 hypothetical protein [Paraburkholderia podalyriae]